jgi:glycosyltransferase involved in cell wall biosynthesis
MLNEEDSILPLLVEIESVFSGIPKVAYEVIIVDDGSIDRSVERVKMQSRNDKRLILVELRRNFGQTAAMAAGIDRTRGKVIITLDADGQNDPKDIPKLLERFFEGFDCVSGLRINRQDRFLSRKLPSILANRIIKRVTKLEVSDYGCTLKVYNGDLLRSIPLYGDMHRLLPFYVALAGGNITEMPVNHRSRKFGTSKYGIGRTFRVINDLLVAKVQESFFTRPMHLFGNMAIGLLVISLVFGSGAVYLKMTGQKDFTQSPLLLASGICILTGLQFITTGLLSEIVLRRLSFASKEQRYATREE